MQKCPACQTKHDNLIYDGILIAIYECPTCGETSYDKEDIKMPTIKPKGNIETLKRLFEIENEIAHAIKNLEDIGGEYWVRHNDIKRLKELVEKLVCEIE